MRRFTFATILTLIRLIISPLLVPMLIVYILPMHSFACNIHLALLFIFLSLTDFFDGYLARRYKQETALGRLLDPIADKFLLFSSLIGLVYVHRLYFYWAIIFIGREFFIMSLREVALSYGFSITVSWWGKVKTMTQNLFITFVIINPYFACALDPRSTAWNNLEHILLGIALFFTLLSAYAYYRVFIEHYRRLDSGDLL